MNGKCGVHHFPCLLNVVQIMKLYFGDASHTIIVFLPFFRKRAREEEIEAAEKAKREREWQKNFEVCSTISVATITGVRIICINARLCHVV